MMKGKSILSDVKGVQLTSRSIDNLLSAGGSEFKGEIKFDDIKVDTIKLVADFQFAVYKPGADIEYVGSCSELSQDIFEGTDLCNDFEELLVSSQHHDVTIRMDEETFQGHKAVFAARSPVFKAMFEHPLKEQVENEVEITDTTPNTWRLFQRFLYTARVSVDGTDLSECTALLLLADKYRVTSLSTKLDEIIESTVIRDNALEVFRLSEQFCLKRSEESAVNTIRKQMEFLKSEKKEEFAKTVTESSKLALALLA